MGINRLALIGVVAAIIGVILAAFFALAGTDNGGIFASRPHSSVNQTDDVTVQDLGPAVSVTRSNRTS